MAESRDEFPNHFVGDLVQTERGWVVVLCLGLILVRVGKLAGSGIIVRHQPFDIFRN